MKEMLSNMDLCEKNEKDLDSFEDIECNREVVAFPPSLSLPNSHSECVRKIISLSLSPYPFSEQQEDVVSHVETECCRLLLLDNNNSHAREIEIDKKPQVITSRTRLNKSKSGSLPWRGVSFWVA